MAANSSSEALWKPFACIVGASLGADCVDSDTLALPFTPKTGNKGSVFRV